MRLRCGDNLGDSELVAASVPEVSLTSGVGDRNIKLVDLRSEDDANVRAPVVVPVVLS